MDQRTTSDHTDIVSNTCLNELDSFRTGVVLLHSLDPTDDAERSLAREQNANDVYRRYQHHLSRQVLRLVNDRRFAHIVLVDDRPIMSIQDKIRAVFARHMTEPSPPAGLSRATIVALGGMSESGKSSAAWWLQQRHGFTRLKIGYLLEQAAARHGVEDVYSLDETTQAEVLVDSLDRFLAAHYFSDHLTIESLHRYHATTALQALLGPTLTTVYVDTPEDLRQKRGSVGAQEIAERDQVKRSRGAHRIRGIADLVLRNDRSALHLYHALDRFAVSLRQPGKSPQARPTTQLAAPPQVTTHLERLVQDLTTRATTLEMIAVTGSGGRGKYQHGWSDLDILIVAGDEAMPAIGDALANLRRGVNGVKLGLTVVTRQECLAGALTPRLIHTLRQLGTGALGVQWRAPGFDLPCPSAATDALTSHADGPASAIELRRQLLSPILDKRAVFKLAALLAKVMLRLEHQDHSDDDRALRAFDEAHPSAFDPSLLNTARTSDTDSRALARAVLNAWLDTLATEAPSS
ncbi:nucleotidyltransferase domain-containing protein [Natronosporangium hydrolyticum]|uniref:Nucleotidyltransferase domain-containing protein n=1 Tax=Natronosporangium hydrolyticum TaxID=2811111 RepID=A0A895YFF2_9ACTN|nr:nucleotidyltransferase domain-containing protein [Natronosporangium hydrolyticum]QSB14179.1 nucleotidyltransferase domain-containing protein [Natronosporangium hydrolyticum]